MKLSKIFNVKAFLYHFLFSLVLIGGLAFFVVSLWYPGVWAEELGGYKLVLMIVLFDLGVGPLCVGFAYKPTKSRKANMFDIVVITLCQLGFFAWGAWTISISRPVYIVFDTDRYEMIVDQDVDPKNLAKTAPFDHIPVFKSMQMAVVDVEATVPDEKERIEVNNDAVFGLDISKSPKYYVPYAGEKITHILSLAKNYERFAKNPETKAMADAIIAKHKLTEDEFKWFPIRYFSPNAQEQLFMTAVVDPKTAEIIDYIVIDPYEI